MRNSILITIDSYLLHCKNEKNLSTKTLKFYKIDLLQFYKFLNNSNHNLILIEISKIHVRNYIESLSPLKPKSIKRKIASLKSFLNFCEFEELIEVNPFRKMKIKIKEPISLPKTLCINDVKNIIQSSYNLYIKKIDNGSIYVRFESIRNLVVLELLFATGIRVSELSYIQQRDVNIELGFIKIMGKGRKERIIHITNMQTIEFLKIYIKQREIYFNKNLNKYLFLNKLGLRLSDQSIRTIVKSHSINVGNFEYSTPHIFRHSLATSLIESGVDISYVQKLLGHSSIITTQIYTHISQVKQKEMLMDNHPRKEFILS